VHRGWRVEQLDGIERARERVEGLPLAREQHRARPQPHLERVVRRSVVGHVLADAFLPRSTEHDDRRRPRERPAANRDLPMLAADGLDRERQAGDRVVRGHAAKRTRARALDRHIVVAVERL
jgi:hypothetical protein